MTEPISVTFVGPDGRATTVRGAVGESVMALTRRQGIEGIVAECGGSMTCATCDVRVADEWSAVTGGPASEIEEEMLDEIAALRGPTSASRARSRSPRTSTSSSSTFPSGRSEH